jgi:hypothetical protein
MQIYALTHPLARATGDPQVFRELTIPWSLILTVNK